MGDTPDACFVLGSAIREVCKRYNSLLLQEEKSQVDRIQSWGAPEGSAGYALILRAEDDNKNFGLRISVGYSIEGHLTAWPCRETPEIFGKIHVMQLRKYALSFTSMCQAHYKVQNLLRSVSRGFEPTGIDMRWIIDEEKIETILNLHQRERLTPLKPIS